MSRTPPTRGRSTSPIRNNSLLLRLYRLVQESNLEQLLAFKAPCGDNPPVEHLPQVQSGSTPHLQNSPNQVHKSGPGVVSRSRSRSQVQEFGPGVGSRSWVQESGSRSRVQKSGLGVGCRSWVHELGPRVWSTR